MRDKPVHTTLTFLIPLATQEAIILAGGLGTRLRGHIGDLPKPMAPVAGRPFLEWQLEALERRGVCRVILSVGFRRQVIESHFGEHRGKLDIAYAREDEPLGTGGAIKAAMELVHGQAAFVLNADTYIRAPLRQLESRPDCDLAVLVARVADAARFGAVEVSRGRLVRFLEKGRGGRGLVNSGVYWMRKSLLQGIEPRLRFSFESEFMERHAASGAICAVETDEPFVDIGVPDSLKAASETIPRLAALDTRDAC
jgi:D-glycero-alpha-D-manno-heptose 1-phosphate guanylyltransferase